MKKWLFILAIIGLGYWSYQRYFNAGPIAMDASGNPTVLLFVFDGCGAPCNDALALLREKKIAFEAVNLSSGQAAQDRLKALGGGRTMPILFVGDRRVDTFHRQRFNESLAERFGEKMLDAADREVLVTHFNHDGSPAVVMYGASWCPHCRAAREYFKDEGIPFQEWDVEKQETGARYYKRIVSSGYPLIYVGYRRIEGFDKTGIQRALGSHRR